MCTCEAYQKMPSGLERSIDMVYDRLAGRLRQPRANVLLASARTTLHATLITRHNHGASVNRGIIQIRINAPFRTQDRPGSPVIAGGASLPVCKTARPGPYHRQFIRDKQVCLGCGEGGKMVGNWSQGVALCVITCI